jgi:predicted transcriptional regulator
LTDILYPERTTAQYATVQKLLERLEGKGCVVRDRTGPVHRFSAALNRDDLIGRRLRDMADRLCEGSLTPLLTHLVRAQRLSAEERQMLRELVGELEPKRTRKK